jgi:hypothetical protein
MVRQTIQQAVQQERERCLKCVECHLPNCADSAQAERLLIRIANLIRNGATDPQPISHLRHKK